MNRRDFFRKSFSKAFAVMEESADEIAETWKQVSGEKKTDPIDPPEESLPKAPKKKRETNRKEDSFLSQTNFPKPKKFKAFRNLQFPPGADANGKRFLSKCTGCGDCMYACPYSVLFPVPNDELGKHLPHMDVNLNACMLCKDFPCIAACPEGALLPYKKNETPKFGKAKGWFQHCINSRTQEKTCEACAAACPVPGALKFKGNKPTFTASCTGCGQCVSSCPTFPKAIVVK
ncbi:4Fe-4S dicluster domain-containing protein [Leptospira fletcheri]|uniref:4Fe-4S dicluster domain-containing protein n=1 Tax=Leptospira fletcheri TaxID=2484981 RepID=A0A4R9GFT9_9LEPT|nr:4Fe-4S dicluster domain-containing protein [Leptospira fletcheri]TGK11544.1 4Fe-4S dicluster domain-containing protein [Leptospira fletcheri]